MSQSALTSVRTRSGLPLGTIATAGLAMGVAADLLLRESGGPGLNFLLLFAGLALAVLVVGRRAGIPRAPEGGWAVVIGLLFALGLVLRASPMLQFLAFVCAAFTFTVPAYRAGGAWLLRSGVREQVEAVAGAIGHSGLGALRLVARGFAGDPSANARGGDGRRRALGILRGLFLAVPFLLVFGALFMAADEVFARLVTDFVTIDLEDIVSHVVPIGVFTWLTCGFLTGLLTGTRPCWPAEAAFARPTLGMLEVGILLSLVDLLFASFVVVQFRYLFGGAGMVEVTPGLTYAEYAREGFAQLAVASALVLPSLLALDWLLRREGPRDDWTYRVLGGVQLLLLILIIASALERLRAYQDAYGLTESRFYGAVFLGWLSLLSIWFAATVLGGRRARFAFPALASVYLIVALLFSLDPDTRIARWNLDRVRVAANGPAVASPGPTEGRSVPPEVDAVYLGSLSADVVPTLLDALPALPPEGRCIVADRLVTRWGPDRRSDWRSWNWSRFRARRTVKAVVEDLREIVRDGGCA